MEARSFADLNDLAFNPPQYPIRPGEEKRDPLTLYIMRVPGTRDVFLSPFKPALKSVTAEDIAASLYYVHLRDPLHDHAHAQPQHSGAAATSTPNLPKISRKALPPGARPITPESPPNGTAEMAKTPSQPGQDVPAPPLPQRTLDDTVPKAFTQPPNRKPVGPRPISLGGPVSQVQNSASQPGRASFSDMRNSRSEEPASSVKSSSPPGSFTLELIRRDRSSGNQWNIALISCSPEQEPAIAPALSPQSTKPGAAPPRPPIDIGIQNSGYAKFRNIPHASILEAGPAAIEEALSGRDASRLSGIASHPSLLPGEAPAPADAFPGATFSRQVHMEYAKSFSSAVKEKLQRLEQAAQQHRGHSRGDSISSWGFFDQTSQAVLSETGKQSLRPRGYAFESPWNGRCEFRTAQAGKALRCVHTLTSGAANGGEPQSMTVSEIRFNLPAYELLPNPGHATNSQLLGQFTDALRPRTYSNEWDDEEVERGERGDLGVSAMDLSLGREKAGGGRRGTRTKMGKLIITGEGLKMLDLVVAANIGVWWETWEKGF